MSADRFSDSFTSPPAVFRAKRKRPKHHLTDHGSYIECSCGNRYATEYAANLHAADST